MRVSDIDAVIAQVRKFCDFEGGSLNVGTHLRALLAHIAALRAERDEARNKVTLSEVAKAGAHLRATIARLREGAGEDSNDGTVAALPVYRRGRDGVLLVFARIFCLFATLAAYQHHARTGVE